MLPPKAPDAGADPMEPAPPPTQLPAAKSAAAPARPTPPARSGPEKLVPLNVDVPESLRRRMWLCRVHTGMDLKAQAAEAIDAWLTARGY